MSAKPEGIESATFFASPGRDTSAELTRQVAAAMADPCVRVLLEAIEGYLLIVNQRRQILAANRDLIEALHREAPDSLVGLRPGEAMNCVHFTEGPNGCGTAKHCQTCGAVLALLSCQAQQARVSGECRLSSLVGGNLTARDFRVTASPLTINGEPLVALVLADISSEKRREVLEQTFLHDVANSLGGIDGWSHLMQQLGPEEAAREILALAETIKSEVFSHRAVLEAERGGLVAQTEACQAQDILEALDSTFQTHPVREGRILKVVPAAGSAVVWTDKGILLRVLANMVKNAFEAIPKDSTVRVWFEQREEGPVFVVENPGVIPEAVEPHLFERSFSTKANKGRGLGTYSMKLLGERYLHGSVFYESRQDTTRFWIVLPADPARPPRPAAPDEPRKSAKVPRAAKAAGCRVLYVEDDEAVSRLGTLFLKQLGYEVVACLSGADAEAAFRAAPAGFAVVITDAQMPAMDGYELSRRLHAIRSDIPILLSTGSTGMEETDLFKNSGFCGVLSKPFSLPDLAEALRPVTPRP